MKRKFSKILGVGLAITVLASLLVMATPASAAALAWSEESTSKNLRTNLDTSNKLAPAGTDIVDLAVSGTTVYAAAQAATGNTTYKSTDGGATWNSLYFQTDYPQTQIPKLVAVASDDANTVVLVTTVNKVYLSSNGGSSWTDLGNPRTDSAAVVNSIAVSSGTTRYIAAGGNNGSGAAELYIIKVAMAESWTPRYSTTDGAKANQTGIFAVKLSPNFTSDKIVTMVSGNATDETWFQAFRNETGALKWNAQITGFTDWSTGIQLTATSAATGIHALAGGPAAANIALVPTYRGGTAEERIAFVAIAGTTSGGGVTRLSDSFRTTLASWSGATLGPIGSLAYHSSGKLLAGDYDAAQVYRFLTPMASEPKAESINSLQQPSGASKTVVAWLGDNAVAATSGDESAFAVSTDSGKTFNDSGLIDTTLAVISDVALNAAASKIYMTTYSDNDTSIWLKTTTWNRVLSLKDYAGGAYKFLVRIAPENDAVVYVAAFDVASTTADNMWVSKNSGATWTVIPNYKLGAIKDFAVQSADVVYAIDTTGLSKSIDAGASWGDKKTATDAFTPYMITLAPNNDVLIGGANSYVAFSKDGGATLTRTQQASTTVSANVHVVADKDYATNNVIYAGFQRVVARGKADATSSFSSRSPTFDASYTSPVIGGLVRDGAIIYALSYNGTVSALSQALNLTPTVTTADLALWSTVVTSSSFKFSATPQALRLTSGAVLWAISSTSAAPAGYSLTSYTNPIATQAPTLTAPADKFKVPVNVTTGRAYNVSFTFKRPAGDTGTTNTNYFQLQIATDSAFGGIVYDYTFTDVDEATETRIIGPNGITNQQVEFMPNTTYYWRIRVAKGGATLQTPWSETRTIVIDKTAPAVAPIPFDIVSPVRGATNVPLNPILTWTPFEGAIGYEIALATDPTFAIIDFSHNVPKANTFYASEPLAYDTTYYWRVRGITGPAPAKKAAPGGDWATGAFTTIAKPVAPTPTVITVEKAAPPAEVKIVEVPVQTVVPQPIPSYLLWIIIVIGAVLVIALIVLIARTRRVA